MATTNSNAPEQEANDKNRQEPHDPVAAGKAAIEAGKIANGNKGAAAEQQDEKKDAEQWRNEG